MVCRKQRWLWITNDLGVKGQGQIYLKSIDMTCKAKSSHIFFISYMVLYSVRSLTTKVSDPRYDLGIKGQTPLTIFDVGALYLA